MDSLQQIQSYRIGIIIYTFANNRSLIRIAPFTIESPFTFKITCEKFVGLPLESFTILASEISSALLFPNNRTF